MNFGIVGHREEEDGLIGCGDVFRGMATVALLMLTCVPQDAMAVPSYSNDIKPIFDVKCVACHACFDSPCQLNLSHPEGLARGLTAVPFYESERLKSAPTTRLFEDAHGAEEWHALGFNPVLGENAVSSLLWAAIQHGNAHVLDPDAPLAEGLNVDVNALRSCPQLAGYPLFAAENPEAGMPYGMARLTADETEIIRRWLDAGAPVDWEAPGVSVEALRHIDDWERFLNGSSPRVRLVARYFYEHVFLGHLYFDEIEGPPDYFRLVRSRTPAGQPVDRISTRRPNEDPGVPRVYYRFERVESTLTRKNHMPFALNSAYLNRLDALFYSGNWSVGNRGAENWGHASDPISAFESIPQRARYQFLLDRSYYFISNFIRGPVCRGPISLNVIADHFFVGFLDPSVDYHPDFVSRVQRKLELPGDKDVVTKFPMELRRVRRGQRRYLRKKGRYLERTVPEGRRPEHLWSGDENARLTIFRHRDSAGVVRGWLGDEPETLWVLDYPLFERIYYNLVANFDVFGSLYHQVSTRVYFDLIRSEAEDNFLLFLSPEDRKWYRSEWYRGVHAKEKQAVQYHFSAKNLPVGFELSSDDPIQAFIDRFSERPSRYALPVDSPERVDQQMLSVARDLMDNEQPFIQFFPEVSLLHVVVDGTVEADRVYTFTHDRAHRNQSFMFAEERRAEPEKDALTVGLGILGNYPNRLYKVTLDELDAFAQTLKAVSDDASYLEFIRRFGYFRASEGLLEESDWIYRWQLPRDPVEAGRLDMNRYGDELKPPAPPTLVEKMLGTR